MHELLNWEQDVFSEDCKYERKIEIVAMISLKKREEHI